VPESTTPLPTCVAVPNLVEGCWIRDPIPNNVGNAGPRPLEYYVVDPLETLSNLRNMCYHAEFGRSRSGNTSVSTETRWKHWARIPPFKVTRSIKVIGTDTNRSTACILVIQSNDELISYRLKKLTISVGNRNFFYPLRVGLFNTSLVEFPLLVWWRENTRMMTLQVVKKV